MIYKPGDTLIHRGWTYVVTYVTPCGNGDQRLGIDRISDTGSGVGFGINGILASEIESHAASESLLDRNQDDQIAELKDRLGRARSDIKELRRASVLLITCVNNMIRFMGPTMAKKFNRLYGIPDVDITKVGQ